MEENSKLKASQIIGAMSDADRERVLSAVTLAAGRGRRAVSELADAMSAGTEAAATYAGAALPAPQRRRLRQIARGQLKASNGLVSA